MTSLLLARLQTANRQIDTVIREVALMTRDARDPGPISKAMLISKLDKLEKKARECERTLELMTRDAQANEGFRK